MRSSVALIVWLITAFVSAVACGGPLRRVGGEKGNLETTNVRSQPETAFKPLRPARADSNVFRDDYVGSAACAECHATIADAFFKGPMHNMTRVAREGTVVAQSNAPWSGGAESTFSFKGDEIVLSQAGRDRFATLKTRDQRNRVYRITRIIGGRMREDYAGIRVQSVAENAAAIEGDEVVLPVSWLIGPGRFRYKGYSVMVKERPGLEVGPVWKQTCIFCHNTVPYASTILGALARSLPAGGNARRRDFMYQGEVVDDLLPLPRRTIYRIGSVSGLEEELTRELTRLGAVRSTTENIVRQTLLATRSAFDATSLVEVGIGCESCHNGARWHAAHPSDKPSLAPRSPSLRVTAPTDESAHAAQVNRVCARCHQVLFSRYPHTWEGGERNGSNVGGSNINSGEARDFLLGACRSKLACTGCHDPHHGAANAPVVPPKPVALNQQCTSCHEAYKEDANLRAHTHHDPRGEGSTCISCHMPRKNMSLDGTLTRYHRIGSPTAPARVLLDRPLECTLCHADFTVEKTVNTMNAWWKTKFTVEEVARLYGGANVNVMQATAKLGKPHEQAVAYATFGEKRIVSATAELEKAAREHEYPLVREYAAGALEKLRKRVP